MALPNTPSPIQGARAQICWEMSTPERSAADKICHTHQALQFQSFSARSGLPSPAGPGQHLRARPLQRRQTFGVAFSRQIAKAKAAFFLFKKKNIDTKGDPSRADGRTRGSGVHILVMSSAGKDAKSKGPEIERFCRSKLQADYVILRTRCLRVCVCCGMRERADKRALRVAERGH